MKPLSKDALLRYTSQLGLMLLSEAGVPLVGRSVPKFVQSEVPFNEKRALLAELNKTLMVLTKVNPEKEQSGLDSMRSMLAEETEDERSTAGSHSGRSNGSSYSTPAVPDEPAEPIPDITGITTIQ